MVIQTKIIVLLERVKKRPSPLLTVTLGLIFKLVSVDGRPVKLQLSVEALQDRSVSHRCSVLGKNSAF